MQYQNYPQYSVNTPVVQPRAQKVHAMVEIPVPTHKVQRQSSGQAPSFASSVTATAVKKEAPRPAVKTEALRPAEPAAEYDLLLLSLAEEYITAAHSIGPMVALYRRSEDLDQYYQLVAMGMSCMEAVLKVCALSCPDRGLRLMLGRNSDYFRDKKRGSLCST
jgi:hypothetical protein